ncbi:MAG: sodium:proton antiporter [bacterium]|nr:sodium:proton antiporter [bacterium]
MRKVLVFSVLLVAGLTLSQALPALFGDIPDPVYQAIRGLTMTGLAFIMIHVGFEFHIDKSNLKSYGWDYFVAFTAASFPWVFVTGYFLVVMLPSEYWTDFDAWQETLLAGRFAAPTSAGVLFSMLVAAGLGATWLYRKARILAIFDDLDTVLLMIPLKMLMVGIAWQLGAVVFVMAALVAVAYIWLHQIAMPITWRWVLFYAAVITGASEAVYAWGKVIDPSVPIHIEVLLPAFALGCLARPKTEGTVERSVNPEKVLHQVLEQPEERRASTAVSMSFMVLVGLSMPYLFGGADAEHPEPTASSLHAAAPDSSVDDPTLHGGQAEGRFEDTVTARQPSMGWNMILVHVLAITVLSNIGKMFPAFCYRDEAHWKHRLAVAIGMWPRGEVGAGVLVLSLSFGIGGPIVTVAMLSLALNLTLTGVFIYFVKRLIHYTPQPSGPSPAEIAVSESPPSFADGVERFEGIRGRPGLRSNLRRVAVGLRGFGGG